MIYYNSNKIIKAYQNGNLINKIDKVVSGGTPSSRLPSGYTEVEYITTEQNPSSNTFAYVETDVTPNENTRVVVDFQAVNPYSVNRRVFGCGNCCYSGKAYILNMEQKVGASNSEYKYRCGNGSSWKTTNVKTDFNRHTADFNNNGVIYLDDVQIGTRESTPFTADASLWLFADKNGGTYVKQEFFMGRMFSCQIYDNGSLVRNYVPCKRDSDNKYGMYDLVVGTFNANASGETSFSGGTEVTPSTAVTSESKTIFQYITDETEPTPPEPPTPTWYTLQDLIDTHTVVSQGNNKYGLSPDVKGITYFRVHMDKVSNTSKYVDLYRDNLSSPPYFGIRDDSSIWLYSAVDGYSSLVQAANSSSCTWAYWLDENTIEVNVQEAMNDTVCLGFYTGGYPTLLLSFAFNV